MTYNQNVPEVNNVVRSDLLSMEGNFSQLSTSISYDHNPLSSGDGYHQKLTLHPFVNPATIPITSKQLVIYNDDNFNIRGYRLDALSQRVPFIVPTKFSSNFTFSPDGEMDVSKTFSVDSVKFNVISTAPTFNGKPEIYYKNDKFYKQDASGESTLLPSFNASQFITTKVPNDVSLANTQTFKELTITDHTFVGNIVDPSKDYATAKIGSLSYNATDSSFYFKKDATSWEKLISTVAKIGVETINSVPASQGGNISLIGGFGSSISNSIANNTITISSKVSTRTGNTLTADNTGLFVPANSSVDAVKYVTVGTSPIKPDSNGGLIFTSSDGSVDQAQGSSASTIDFKVNTLSLVSDITDDTRGTSVINGKIGIELDTQPDNILSFVSGKLYGKSSGSTDTKAIYSLNSVLPNSSQSIGITSPDGSINVINDISKSAIELSVKDASSLISTINTTVKGLAGNVNFTSSNSSIKLANNNNSVDFTLDPLKVINPLRGLEVDQSSKIGVSISTDSDNALSIQPDGSLKVKNDTSLSIKSINSVVGNPSSAFDLLLTAKDTSSSLTINNIAASNTIELDFSVANLVSAQAGNGLSVASDNKLFAQGGSGSSTLQSLLDSTGTVVTGAGSSTGIQFTSTDGSVVISGTASSTAPVINFKAVQPKAEDFSLADSVYIASSGDDTTGLGTYAAPYKTVTKASSALTNPRTRIDIVNSSYPYVLSEPTVSVSTTNVNLGVINLTGVTVDRPVKILAVSPDTMQFDINCDVINESFNLEIDSSTTVSTKPLTINIRANQLILGSNNGPIITIAPQTVIPYEYITVNLVVDIWDESKINPSQLINPVFDFNTALCPVVFKLNVLHMITPVNQPAVKTPLYSKISTQTGSGVFVLSASYNLLKGSVFNFDDPNITSITSDEIRTNIVKPNTDLVIPTNTDLLALVDSVYKVGTTLRHKTGSGATYNIITEDNLSDTVSSDSGNLLTIGTDSKLSVKQSASTGITTLNSQNPLNTNFVLNSPDSTISVSSATGAIGFVVDANNLISKDPGNAITLGTDKKLLSSGGTTGGISKINSTSPNASGEFSITASTPSIQIAQATNGITVGVDTATLVTSGPNAIEVFGNAMRVSLNAFISTLNNKGSDSTGNFNLTSRGSVTITPGTNNIDLDVATGSGVEKESGSGLLSAKLSTDSNNVAVFGSDKGIYVPQSSIGKFLKTINSIPGDTTNDNIALTSDAGSLAFTPKSTSSELNIDVIIAQLISSDQNNTIKSGTDGKLLSDTGSSTAGINTINNVQPNATKNLSFISSKGTVSFDTSITNSISLDVAIQSLLSTDSFNELIVSPTDSKLYINTDKDYIKQIQGITALENNVISFVGSDQTLSFVKDTGNLGNINASLILSPNGNNAFSKINGLGLKVSQVTNNAVELKPDGVFVEKSSAFSTSYGIVYLDTQHGLDTNTGTEVNEPVKTMTQALTVATSILGGNSIVTIKSSDLSSRMAYSGDIVIPDSKIKLDLDNLDWSNGTLYINNISDEVDVKIRNCTNCQIELSASTTSTDCYVSVHNVINATGKQFLSYKGTNNLYITCNAVSFKGDVFITASSCTVLASIGIIKNNYSGSKIMTANAQSSYSILAGGSNND